VRAQRRFGGHHLVLEALVDGELADELQHLRHFVLGGGADGKRCGHGDGSQLVLCS